MAEEEKKEKNPKALEEDENDYVRKIKRRMASEDFLTLLRLRMRRNKNG